MKKYRFRKMYFICTDKKVIEPNTHMTNAYQNIETAQRVCKERSGGTHKMWDDKTKPVPVNTVEGFYLVHESLFDKILKNHVKD